MAIKSPSVLWNIQQSLLETEQEQARQNIGLAKVSHTGNYNDLINKPSIPSKTSDLQNDSGFITSSAIPIVNDKTFTIQRNGVTVETFTANSNVNKTANINVPDNLFVATYGVSTWNELEAAYNAGKAIILKGADFDTNIHTQMALYDFNTSTGQTRKFLFASTVVPRNASDIKYYAVLDESSGWSKDYISGNVNGYNKATGSAVRGLLDLGKFSYSSNHEIAATFRISYTDARQYAPVEILLRLQIKYSGNATDGIVSIDSGKFYAYKIRSGQNRNTTDYECYLRIIDGELHVLVGMTSTTTAQANIVLRCLWNVQAFQSPFTELNESITELPDYTSMIVVPKYHMAYADAAGADGAPVTVDKYGKLLPLDRIQATSVGYLRLDGTVDDFDTYSVMVMDADGVVYKDASAYKKLAYRAQDNCIGSNIDGWATMLEPKALSSIPSEAPDILHVPLLDSSRYVRIDQSSTPTRMVYSRSTNTLSVNVNGSVNGKTFVFGAYAGELNTVYFC
jgi:hypothetical protein